MTDAPLDDLDILKASFLAAYSGRTREAYATDLRQWLTWLATIGVPPLEAKRRHVKTWAAELTDAGRAPGTICRKLSAVSGFYTSAVYDDALEVNPCNGVRRPKVSQESTRDGLDKPELIRVLTAATEAGLCELALVLLLGHNGLRISEACGLRLQDLGEDHGEPVITIHGKGGKVRKAPLETPAAAAVAALIAARKPAPGDELLPYNRYQGRRVIIKLAEAAGIRGKNITPHSLRHSFVTLSLEGGAALQDVQDSAGHADPRTTQRYNRARNKLKNNSTHALTKYLEAS